MVNFEDLLIRQESQKITVLIYKLMKECKDFGFRDQIQRASISIMNNIAEGHDRQSIKDKIKYFVIAKSSAAEVRSMVSIGFQIGYMSGDDKEHLTGELKKISIMIYRFIQSLS